MSKLHRARKQQMHEDDSLNAAMQRALLHICMETGDMSKARLVLEQMLSIGMDVSDDVFNFLMKLSPLEKVMQNNDQVQNGTFASNSATSQGGPGGMLQSRYQEEWCRRLLRKQEMLW